MGQVFLDDDLAVALEDVSRNFAGLPLDEDFDRLFAGEDLLPVSGTHFGQSESVVRGQPSGGLVFSYDLSRGLSDHLGLGEGFCLIRFRRSNTAHAPVAATVTAFSTYFTGLCMSSRFPLLGIMASQASATSPWVKLQLNSANG